MAANANAKRTNKRATDCHYCCCALLLLGIVDEQCALLGFLVHVGRLGIVPSSSSTMTPAISTRPFKKEDVELGSNERESSCRSQDAAAATTKRLWTVGISFTICDGSIAVSGSIILLLPCLLVVARYNGYISIGTTHDKTRQDDIRV